jgi:hypothetical protein
VPAGQQGAAIELVFSDEQLRPLEPVVRLALDPLEFDERAASGGSRMRRWPQSCGSSSRPAGRSTWPA